MGFIELITIDGIFNNREIAIGIWLFIFSIWSLSKNGVGQAILGVIKAALDKKIFTIIVLMLAYVSLLSFALLEIGLWDIAALRETIYWIVGVGFS